MNSPFSIAGVIPASQLQRPAAPTVSCGIATVDELTGGLPRGALTEICGPASSGRTSLLLAALGTLTHAGESCALVDAGDSFDPRSAAATVDLDRLLWVRCGGTSAITRRSRPEPAERRGAKFTARQRWFRRVEQALKATDLLIQGGGFGLIAVDLADVPPEVARRIPLASWFRFRRAVERTSTVLLVLEQEPYAKACASLVLRTSANNSRTAIDQTAIHARTGAPLAELATDAPVAGVVAHGQLFRGITVEVEVASARVNLGKKASRNVGAAYETRAEWAG